MSASILEVQDCFKPSRANGLRARKAIHERLHESLSHVFEQCSEHCEFDRIRADALLSRTRTGERLPPTLFGHFFCLVETIEKDSLQDVVNALEKVLAHANCLDPVAIKIRPFNRSNFREKEESAFRRQFVSDSLVNEQIAHLSEDAEGETIRHFERALEILRNHAPQTFSEIEILASEIVPATGHGVGGFQFDGSSSLERWGTVLINANLDRTDLELGEAITHETAHNALFAMSPVEFHVDNDPEERYQSPLRLDKRPMNGIYHATFVLARMCFAMTEIAESSSAEEPLKSEATKLAEASRILFADGYRVLEKHANYTAEGRAIMQDAVRYMRNVRS